MRVVVLVHIVRPGCHVCYGGGVNRGLGALAAEPSQAEWVLVSNADLEVHPGALGALRE